MKKRGEITVFLSLTIVCIISLFTGLLESARTAGARLYLQMAANSSMDSVMSQYNRNLWDMYHLLFLETGSETAVLQSFETYLDYYLKIENWYPMKLKETQLTEMESMIEKGGTGLEKEILSYAEYCLPEIIGEIFADSDESKEVQLSGDFRNLFQVCRQAGKKTAKLERNRKKAEKSLKKMNDCLEEMRESAGDEEEGGVMDAGEELLKEIGEFSDHVEAYEKEAKKISEYKKELETSKETEVEDTETSLHMKQELLAYGQVDQEAGEQLLKYRETEKTLKEIKNEIEAAMDSLKESDSPDWDFVYEILEEIEIPEGADMEEEDEEKAGALEKLEELLSGDLLQMVVPKDRNLSKKQVSISKIPSSSPKETGDEKEENVLEKGTVNEYIFLYFDSFLRENGRGAEKEKKQLLYEQEYLLCGENSDRKNLKETVEKLFAIRGSVNLMYLLGTPERKTEADSLAAAVCGGSISAQLVISFFIMVMWALGEAVWDIKCLLDGGRVSFFKTSATWRLGIEDLLTFRFLDRPDSGETEGKNYQDYMRILFLFLDRWDRNYRLMDLIQWNVRTVQSDFAAADCMGKIKIKASVINQHVFAMKSEYIKSIELTGSY